MSLSFVALDFETANQKRGSVIQLGIAKYVDGALVGKATTFITPPPGLGRFDKRCTDVHGIFADKVVGAPDWPSILNRITVFAGGDPLVAHSASVERSCIVQASEAHGLVPPEFRYFCTWQAAKKVFPGQVSYSLGKLSAAVGLPAFAHHDAGADAIASATLLLAMAGRTGATSLDQLDGFIRPAPRRKAQ